MILDLAEVFQQAQDLRTPATRAVQQRFERWLQSSYGLTPEHYAAAVQAQMRLPPVGAGLADGRWVAVETPRGEACLHRAEVDAAQAAIPAQGAKEAVPALDAWLTATYRLTFAELEHAAGEAAAQDQAAREEAERALHEKDRALAPPGSPERCWDVRGLTCGFEVGSGQILYHGTVYTLAVQPPPGWGAK